MDLSKLTPAPWGRKRYDVTERHEDEPVTVAKCWSSSFAPPPEESETNAEFIALARNAFDFWVNRDPKAAIMWLEDTEKWYNEQARTGAINT